MGGLLLSSTAFNTLSAPAQQEVLASIGLNGISLGYAIGTVPDNADTPNLLTSADGEGPVELTIAMVRKLTKTLSGKTLNTLKIIASGESPQFHLKDVIERTEGASDRIHMRSVWAGLTRRTRTVMGEPKVILIRWAGGAIRDEDGDDIDHLGTISPLTHQSLRAHFGF